MTRIDICAADDFETQARLLEALHRLGATWDGASDDGGSLPTGVTWIRFDSEQLTIFKDAWLVDLAGPGVWVERIRTALAVDS